MKKKRKNQERQRSEVLRFLQKNYHITADDILVLQKQKEKEQKERESHYIPVSLFTETPLSSLELITVFLRETKGLTFAGMETILGRDQRVLSTTYRNAKKKNPEQLKITPTKYYLPCHIIANTQLSVLETIASYLKREYKLTNAAIAVLLNKDQRTIWTVLNRARSKVKT